MEEAFNKIPDIDTTGSDKFKEAAERIIIENIPNWVNYLTINYNDYPEDTPLNMIAQGSISRRDTLYMDSLYRRIKLPRIIIQKVLLTLFQKNDYIYK